MLQIKGALAGMNAKQTLLADANGGWTVEDACHMIAQFDDPRLIWEEPCQLYENHITVAAKTQQPLMSCLTHVWVI